MDVQVFQEYGLPESQRMAVFIYGGQPPGEWRLREECLPKGWTCIVCAAGSPPGGDPLPTNFILAPADAYTPDLVGPSARLSVSACLWQSAMVWSRAGCIYYSPACVQIAASDALIGKIGYGTVSECLAHGKPLVFVRRDYFNEEPFLRRLLQIHHAAVEIRRRDFLEGNWAPFLMAASELKVTFRLSSSQSSLVMNPVRRASQCSTSTSAYSQACLQQQEDMRISLRHLSHALMLSKALLPRRGYETGVCASSQYPMVCINIVQQSGVTGCLVQCTYEWSRSCREATAEDSSHTQHP